MDAHKIAIGLVGEKGSGKGTISNYLNKKYQGHQFRFSRILDELLARLYLMNSRNNQINLVLALRDLFGSDILAQVLKKDIENDTNQLVIVDGIRYWDEYHVLKELPNFFLVYVTATPQMRYERILKRGEKAGETDQNFEQFMEEEKRPTEVTITEIGKVANFKLENSGSIEDLHSKMGAIMETVLQQVQ